jgi:NitT/TauT family transport system ATP-binding protein
MNSNPQKDGVGEGESGRGGERTRVFVSPSPPLPLSPSESAVSIHLQNVEKTFDASVQAISSLTFNIASGEFLAILGPSGCGKSTLLRLIAGLDQPTGGTVQLQPSIKSHNLAYVFQDAHLLPWRNVLRNVALPLELAGITKSDRLDAAAQALKNVGLSDALKRYPAQLSGGMRMRVSLARALVTHPKLLLLDEPFAALDEITRQNLDEQLRNLWLEHRMTVLFVTHSTAEATFLADRAIVLTRRPARLVSDIPIDLPPQRDGMLRGSPAFAAATALIYESLQKGGA